MMRDLTRIIRLITTALMVSLMSFDSIGGITTVTLRSTVRVSHEQPITLADIGAVEGDQAEFLADLNLESLLDGVDSKWCLLSSDDLRGLIERDAQLNGGSIVIEGTSSSVRRMGAAPVSSKTTPLATQREQLAADGPIVRDHVDRWVRDRYRIGTDLVRMTFRDLDEPFLETTTAGRLVEIREISRRGRTAIRVIVLDELIVVEERALIFDVEIFRDVLIANQRVNRGTHLDATKFMTERRWVTPEEQSVHRDDAVGMALSKTINPGQLITVEHVELPLVIRRGDIVSAKSISGSVVVTVRGRAKSNARLGETIEFESMNGENHFRAKATGKGRAAILKEGNLS
jgi:flagella basal body P-ring formation protein FlgA